MSSLGSRASIELPPIDEHIVPPELGYEMDDGELVRVAPSLEPHANCHSKIAALLEAHKGPAFDVAVDMLTRTSLIHDFAPDVSVYPRARDPGTGRRQLEHLAFEVVSTETLGHAGRKAGQLAGRGVRRVFAVDVERARAFEWSRELESWRVLDPGSLISDLALAVPLPVRALLDALEADEAVGRALLARRNRAIEEAVQGARTEGHAQGLAEGRAELAEDLARAILAVLGLRALELSDAERVQILRERDPARLRRWIERAGSCPSAAELLAIR
jgi:Uma2 family endonuclease